MSKLILGVFPPISKNDIQKNATDGGFGLALILISGRSLFRKEYFLGLWPFAKLAAFDGSLFYGFVCWIIGHGRLFDDSASHCLVVRGGKPFRETQLTL